MVEAPEAAALMMYPQECIAQGRGMRLLVGGNDRRSAVRGCGVCNPCGHRLCVSAIGDEPAMSAVSAAAQ
eukprot:scaffold107004_cov33-Tisochrysis_lutea.AAC.8